MPANKSGRRRRTLYWLVAVAVAGFAAAFFARPYAAAAYHRWSAQRLVRRAADSLAQGDPRRALLDAKTVLRKNLGDAEATRIMAQALEALGMPEAEDWRQRLDCLRPGDAENVPTLARALLKSSGWESAEQCLDTLPPAARDSAAFHAVAAAISMEKRDTVAAESHLAEAARLEPGDKRHRLSLAAVRLDSRIPGQREAALAALREMRTSPATSIEALRQLLADATRRREAASARNLADALVAEGTCTFKDRLARLTTLRLTADARSTPYLLELRDAAMGDATNLYTLLMWMNANDLALMVDEWVRWMPQEMISRPPAALAVAEAFMRSGAWQRLEDLTGTAKWGEVDFVRKAFLACALEHLGEEEDAAKEWADAVAAGRGRGNALDRLARFAIQAKWERRAGELMRVLAGMPQCPRWVTDSLWKDALQRGDTAQLQKISRIQVKADPRGIAARNNYAFLSLLMRNAEGNPQRIAEALHREHPENALVTATYALSLYQQGRPGNAVALMAALKPEDLRHPQVALYYAIFLLAERQPEKAAEYMTLAKKWPMLPEETALLERAGLKRPESPSATPPTGRASPAE